MTRDAHRPWWLWPLLVVLLPLTVVALSVWLVVALFLLAIAWLTWCTRGRYALVVYSNSPIWQEYFERRVIPELAGRAAVLNWSERKAWKHSFAVMLFQVFAGRRDFNPVAIVFEPWTWPRWFRFYRAFRSFKHGSRDEVERVRGEFLSVLNALSRGARHDDGTH